MFQCWKVEIAFFRIFWYNSSLHLILSGLPWEPCRYLPTNLSSAQDFCLLWVEVLFEAFCVSYFDQRVNSKVLQANTSIFDSDLRHTLKKPLPILLSIPPTAQNKKNFWNSMRETDRLGIIVLMAISCQKCIRQHFFIPSCASHGVGHEKYYQTNGQMKLS